MLLSAQEPKPESFDSHSCTLHCAINTAGQKDSNVYLKYGIPNEINCVQPHIMFLKHLLIIHASNNTQSFSDEIKRSTFLSDLAVFRYTQLSTKR